MNLTHAPAEQLANARAALKAVRVAGLRCCRTYTSWNSVTKKVRVKCFMTLRSSANAHYTAKQQGFVDHVNRARTHSYVGEF